MNSSKKIKSQQDSEAVTTAKVPEKTVKKEKKISRFAGVNKKPVILATLCIIVVLVLCIGVGIQQFQPKVVVTVDKTKITMNDMMYPIYEVESQYLPYNEMYETYTGKSIWESDYQGSDASGSVSGLTNSIGLKQEVLNAETQYELLYQYAKKAGYKLSKEDKEKAKKQVKKALKGLSWLQKLQLNITEKNLTTRFEKRILAGKYQEDKQKELNKTVDEKAAIKDISKKDYRQYDVQFYYVATTTQDDNGNAKAVSDKKKATYKEKITKIAKDASKKGADFTKLIDKKEKDITFEKDGNFTEKDGWTYVSEANLKKIKKMKNGEVSDVILDEESGYYVVVKMVNNNSEEAYKSACDSAIKSEQDEAYSAWFEEEQTDKVVVNTDVWTDVTIGTVTTDIVTAEDLNDMKEDSSSKKSSKGSNQ